MIKIALFAVAACLFGCGSSKKDAAAAPAVSPEVTRLNIDQLCFAGSINNCTLTLGATFSNGATGVSAPYSLVISILAGTTAPAACDAASKSGLVVQFQDLKLSTAYTLRGCVFDGQKYTPGIAVPFTTGAGT